MTNTEALQAVVSIELDANTLEKVLLDNGVTGTDTYTAALTNTIELCSAYVYKILCTAPDFKQGSYAITNRQAENFKKLANTIFKKAQQLETSQRYSQVVIDNYFCRGREFFDIHDYIDKITSVNIEDLKRIAKEILNGPYKLVTMTQI